MCAAIVSLSIASYCFAAATTTPATPSPSIAPLIHPKKRIQKISFTGHILAVSSTTIEVMPSSLHASAVTLNAENAQIIHKGRKNSAISDLTAGDTVRVRAQIMPDDTYIAQHITAIIPPKHKKVAVRKQLPHKKATAIPSKKK